MIGLALTLMELGFTYPWSLVLGLWLTREPRPLLSAWAILLLVGGAQLLGARLGRIASRAGAGAAAVVGADRGAAGAGGRGARAARAPGVPSAVGVARLAAMVLGLTAVLALAWLEHGPPTLDLTPTTLALALGVHLWRRGLLHAQGPASRERVERSLAAGTLALAACLLLSAAEGAPSLAFLQASGGAYVVGFYGVGLLALAIARLREARRRAGPDAPAESARGWLGLVGGIVAALLLVALLAGQLLSFDLATAVLRPILWAISAVLFVVFLVFGLPLMLALEVLLGWVREHLRGLPPVEMDLRGRLGLEELRRGAQGEPPPAELLLIAQWLAVGLVVAVAAVLIARALLWRSSSTEEDDVPEERDSVWSWAIVLGAVRAWLAALRGRFARRAPAAADALDHAAPAQPLAGATLRHLYRDVLAAAASRGAPRPPSSTPGEHLPRLDAALGPDLALTTLTDAYVRLRYGAQPPPDAELAHLRRWWAERPTEQPAPPASKRRRSS